MLSTFIKLPLYIKIFVWSIFKWPLKTGLTVIELGHLIGFGYDLSDTKDGLMCLKNGIYIL